jgi:hypothetical protein
MKKMMMVSAVALALSIAAPAMALNAPAYLAGTAPAAGSAEEAEVCATSGVVIMLLTGDNAEYKELNETAKLVAVHWVPKASQFRGIDNSAYLDTAVTENVTAISEAEIETHTAHFLECMKRTPNLPE